MITIPVQDDAFAAVGINKGDALMFDEDAEPAEGDFTLLEYKGKYQLVQLIGWDFMKHPIICQRYTTYPNAVSLPCKINLKGRMTGVCKGGDAL